MQIKLDKRHNKKVIQTPKKCLWCNEIIEIHGRSPAQYNKINVHRECVTSWRHHRCAKDMVKQKSETYCLHCKKLLVRRDNEQRVAWMKRETCGKSCASFASTIRSKCRAVKTEEPTDEQLSHVKRYVPGTPEFAMVASQYMR
jgi:hypothetical protein